MEGVNMEIHSKENIKEIIRYLTLQHLQLCYELMFNLRH